MNFEGFDTNEVGTKETLWICHQCNIWWVSQPTGTLFAWRLIPMVELDDVPARKNQPPGWVVYGPDPSTCPECSQTMKRQKHIITQEVPTLYMALCN